MSDASNPSLSGRPKARLLGRAFAVLGGAAALVLLAALLPLGALAAPHPDACVEGFVWRETFPGDHVCVTPEVREETRRDNRLAASRRMPGGGAFGPDTCKPGFVWREARADDHVCVTPEVRARTARENRLALSRRLHPPAAANGAPPRAARSEPRVSGSVAAPTEVPREVPATRNGGRLSIPTPDSAPAPVEARSHTFTLPAFPWPPPPYSTRLRIARPLLVTTQPEPTNRSVARRMETALAANGYTLVSYYAVPNGFAMVTQVERIDPDAASAAEQRWSTEIDPVRLIPFNLEAYIDALLGRNGDSFRVLVFTFTPTPFTADARPIPPEEALAWVEKGATALPAALAAQPYGENVVCTALVYEFRISSLGAALRRPSDHDGLRHLRAAGILDTLETLP